MKVDAVLVFPGFWVILKMGDVGERNRCSRTFLRWIYKMPSLSSSVGTFVRIFMSNRPDRINASSRSCCRLVAAINTIFSSSLKPSSSANSWLSVELRSWSAFRSFSPWNLFLLAPMQSISSMNMMHGWWLRAYRNKSLILFAPTPT